MNKAEFLRELTRKRAEWDELLAGIPHDEMTRAGVNGEGWSVKDIIAHVAWYENEATSILRGHALASESPENDKMWEMSTDERNKAIYRQNRSLSLDEVMVAEREAYEAFLAEAQKLAEEDLTDATLYKGMPADWTPWEVVASNTFEHYPEHVAEVRAWQERNS